MENIFLDKELIGVKGSRHKLSTPALLLDLDALEQNILAMAEFSLKTHVKLRPHCKSHKCVKIARLQIEAGALGISCATIGEAEEMAKGGIQGILITSPITHPSKIERLIRLHENSQDLMVVSDSIENINILSKANAKSRHPLQILVDFDVGQKRTGAPSVLSAIQITKTISEHPSLRYKGIQAYAGHLQHIADYKERSRLMQEQGKRIQELCHELEKISMKPEIITGGGTGTFHIDAKEKIFTELQTGSYIFLDVQYKNITLQPDTDPLFRPSLFVLTSIISMRENTYITDGGLKAFATDGPSPQVFAGAPLDTPYEFMGDEHGKLGPCLDNTLRVGDMLECLTPHCDPTVNLYDAYSCVRGNVLEDIWRIEGRGKH